MSTSFYSSSDGCTLARTIHLLAPILHECIIKFTKTGISITSMTADKSVRVWLPYASGDLFSFATEEDPSIGVDLCSLAGWMRNIKDGMQIKFTIDHKNLHPVTQLPSVSFTRIKKQGSITTAELTNLRIDYIEPNEAETPVDSLVKLGSSEFDNVLSSHLSNHTNCSIGISSMDKNTGRVKFTFNSFDPMLNRSASTIVPSLQPVHKCEQPNYSSRMLEVEPSKSIHFDVKKLKRINKANFCSSLLIGLTAGAPLIVTYLFDLGGYIEFRLLSNQEIKANQVKQGQDPDAMPVKKAKLRKKQADAKKKEADTMPEFQPIPKGAEFAHLGKQSIKRKRKQPAKKKQKHQPPVVDDSTAPWYDSPTGPSF